MLVIFKISMETRILFVWIFGVAGTKLYIFLMNSTNPNFHDNAYWAKFKRYKIPILQLDIMTEILYFALWTFCKNIRYVIFSCGINRHAALYGLNKNIALHKDPFTIVFQYIYLMISSYRCRQCLLLNLILFRKPYMASPLPHGLKFLFML